MGNAVNIKNEVINSLQNLQNAGTINDYFVLNHTANIAYDVNVNDNPVAVVMPPGTTGETLDNRTRLDTITYNVGVFYKIEDLNGNTAVEDLIDKFIQEFADRVTLSGAADGGLTLQSGTTDIVDDAQDLGFFALRIDAKAQRTLNF